MSASSPDGPPGRSKQFSRHGRTAASFLIGPVGISASCDDVVMVTRAVIETDNQGVIRRWNDDAETCSDTARTKRWAGQSTYSCPIIYATRALGRLSPRDAGPKNQGHGS